MGKHGKDYWDQILIGNEGNTGNDGNTDNIGNTVNKGAGCKRGKQLAVGNKGNTGNCGNTDNIGDTVNDLISSAIGDTFGGRKPWLKFLLNRAKHGKDYQDQILIGNKGNTGNDGNTGNIGNTVNDLISSAIGDT